MGAGDRSYAGNISIGGALAVGGGLRFTSHGTIQGYNGQTKAPNTHVRALCEIFEMRPFCPRITSYNVCYTKLLRYHLTAGAQYEGEPLDLELNVSPPSREPGATEQGQTRDPTQESGRQEGVATSTTASIRITIPRPGLV